jgi:sRNA-binding regulator protein Hfq
MNIEEMMVEYKGSNINIHLINGIKLIGKIQQLNINEYITIGNHTDNKEQTILWSAIATISKTQVHNLEYSQSNNNPFLFSLINICINVYLCNGIKLQGELKNFHWGCFLVILRDSIPQIVLWYSIATIGSDINHKLVYPSILLSHFASNLVRKPIVIFLKSGIKLKGLLSYVSDDAFILDDTQIVLALHMATISLA